MASLAAMSQPMPPWLRRAWTQFRNALGEQRLGHALLIAGEAGLGKRHLAGDMAARLLCPAPDDLDRACGRCSSCIWLAAGTHPDFSHVRPEEDSQFIKVDQIRELSQRLQLTGQLGPTRVALIEPVEAMNVAAQNALLKTLEEPAAGVHLILVSDALARVLPTIRSRCQGYVVVAPDLATARDWLAEQGLPNHELALALAAGHPATSRLYADPERARQAVEVAEDLRALTQGAASAMATATRWQDQPERRIDDAIAWLRLWCWRDTAIELPPHPAAPAAAVVLSDRYRSAVQLRERLRTPLKDSWLLHEWLREWQP